MLASFSIIFVAILFWLVPWFPYGLSPEDYNERLAGLLGLLAMASVTAFGAVYHRDLSRRVEQTILTWSTVHEGLGDARKREYFYDRIVIQCERAKAAGSEFTVVALRLEGSDKDEFKSTQNSEKALRILTPTAEESECLAILGPHEIGILAPKADSAHAAAFAERLRSLVAMTAEATLKVRVGWAVYPTDSVDAGSLVGVARERLLGRKHIEVAQVSISEPIEFGPASPAPVSPATEDESTSYKVVA